MDMGLPTEGGFRPTETRVGVQQSPWVVRHRKKETIVSADASSYGLGAVIRQRQKDGTLNAVAYASRLMTKTKCRYAQIDKEALATTWTLEHWSDVLIGLKFPWKQTINRSCHYSRQKTLKRLLKTASSVRNTDGRESSL